MKSLSKLPFKIPINKRNYRKILISNLPFLFFGFAFFVISKQYRPLELLGIYQPDIVVAVCGAVIVKIVFYFRKKNAKKYRNNVEYGSARWGNEKDIAPYTDENPDDNIIITNSESLTMNSRPKMPKYARNKNVLIIGGSGKTRFYVKPNIMQCQSKAFPVSFIVTDPKGTCLVETGKMLQRNGYKIKILNTIDFAKSMKYNPIAYIRNEKDILKLVTALIANTKGEGKGGDDFRVKAETLLYCALLGYIFYECPPHEKNLNTLTEMISAMEVREDEETFKNSIDMIFERLEKRGPNHFAVRQYAKYRLAAGVICSEGLFNRSPFFNGSRAFAAQTDGHHNLRR